MVNEKSLNNLKKFKSGESGNKSGVSSKIARGSQIFKESLFAFYQKNTKLFEKAMKEHPLETLKIIASICPRNDEVNFGKETFEFFQGVIDKYQK